MDKKSQIPNDKKENEKVKEKDYKDKVDETSDESFPASDPPGWIK